MHKHGHRSLVYRTSERKCMYFFSYMPEIHEESRIPTKRDKVDEPMLFVTKTFHQKISNKPCSFQSDMNLILNSLENIPGI